MNKWCVEQYIDLNLTLGGAVDRDGDRGVPGGDDFSVGLVGSLFCDARFFLTSGVLGCKSAAINPSLSCTSWAATMRRFNKGLSFTYHHLSVNFKHEAQQKILDVS